MDQLRVFGASLPISRANFGPSPDGLSPDKRDGSTIGLLTSSGVSDWSHGGSSGDESGLKAFLTFRDLESLPRPNGVS